MSHAAAGTDRFACWQANLSESAALVQRFRNNWTLYLSISPIAQSKKPQRSPLRLRFLLCTLGKISFVYSPAISNRCTGAKPASEDALASERHGE